MCKKLAVMLLALVAATPVALADPTGACCSNVSGNCEILTFVDCEAVSGLYQGDDTSCDGVTCPDPTGACCFSDGDCFIVEEVNCVGALGNYQGNNTKCNPNPCPPPVGACCSHVDGTCTDGVTESFCLNSIFGAFQGVDTTCSGTTCPQAGACCDPDDAFCIIRTQYLCELIGRNFLGENTTCEPNVCPEPPRGACCQESGECQPDMFEYTCLNQTSGGVWAGEGTTCDPENPCPQPAFGACCFGTGGCLITAEYLCADAFGEFFGEGSTCWPVPCDPNAIVGWCDNLDSYADATLMYQVGGWTGWDDTIGAAGTISTAQAHSAPNSMRVSNSDCIHPFTTAYSGGVWEIRMWQYIPSGLDNTSYLVVNSYYEHGGPYFFPVEIHFEPTTGQVVDALRDTNGTSTLPIVYDQWVPIRIVADFTTTLGTIHEYYNEQLLYTGDWIVGFVGQLAIMNIDLYAPHNTPVYYDDLCIEVVSESTLNPKRPLFVGSSDSSGGLTTRSTDLSNFPNVTWNEGTGGIAVEGAAGRPDGTLYLAGTSSDDSFRPKLFHAAFEGPAVPVCQFGTSFTEGPSGLAYGRGKLYGFYNFKSPLGIYEIDPETCESTLVVATGSRRFFALDYNAADGLLYGYDSFGSPTGLCSINIDTQEITWIAASAPADNSSANAMAIGYNTVYLAGTRGADGVPMFTYDLSQGPGGTWTAMTQAFPESNAQAGAAFAPGPVPGDMNCDGKINGADIQGFQLALIDGAMYTATNLDCTILNADTNLDGSINYADVASFVSLLLND